MNDSQLSIVVSSPKDIDPMTMGILISTGQAMIETGEREASVEIESPTTAFLIKTDFQYTTIGAIGGYIFYASLEHVVPPVPVTLVMPPMPKACKLTLIDMTLKEVVKTGESN